MSKVLCVVQARCHSTRFPFKVFEKIRRVPVIVHVVRRARQLNGLAGVVVAVPRKEGGLFWQYLRGIRGKPGVVVTDPYCDEGDVLGRFVSASGILPDCDTLVRVTSDCPVLQPAVCDALIEGWRASGCEYGWLDTDSGQWPDGLDCEVFTRDLLMKAHAEATDSCDREHVTSWMRRNAGVYSLPTDPVYAGWPKLSIDVPEDLERVRRWKP